MPWDLNGNKNTNPTTNFLGTTDNQPLVVKTNGAERMRIAPDGAVDVSGGMLWANNSVLSIDQGGSIELGSDNSTPGTGTPYIDFHFRGLTQDFNTRIINDADRLLTINANTLRVTGNVGLGTSNPGARLEINNGDLLFKAAADDPGDVIFQSASGGQKGRIWSNPSAGAGLFLSSGDHTPRLSITAAGNVGIGTAAPGSRLTVDVPGSNNPISAMSIDVQSFGTQPNAQASYYFRVRDIGAAPPGGFTPFLIRGDGNVEVAGDIRLSNADCAEDFEVAEAEDVEPGTVMVIDEQGAVKRSQQAYDKRVAGVVSGASGFKPGIILDKQGANEGRMPVALMGKVYCKVDARPSPIGVGDLLTTSPTPGHAMKADDPVRASGAIIGKTLQGLTGGLGLVPILVSLQ
jgi:hypothetical protein